jgi:hypothetical protein
MTSPATKKKIELYSFDYYAACTLGGILACVSNPIHQPP